MRFSIHIDAGYLYNALATRETGSANRAAISVDEATLIKSLVAMGVKDSGMRLLRVLWYDAAKDGIPEQHHRKIGMIDSVKLRMGRINYYGEQKGVDLRLGLDLVSLGVNRAAEVAYLVSGDDDLTEAVSDAQDLGLQVKLMTVPVQGGGRQVAVAGNLSLAVDGILSIDDDVIADTVRRIIRHDPDPEPQPDPGADGLTVQIPRPVLLNTVMPVPVALLGSLPMGPPTVGTQPMEAAPAAFPPLLVAAAPADRPALRPSGKPVVPPAAKPPVPVTAHLVPAVQQASAVYSTTTGQLNLANQLGIIPEVVIEQVAAAGYRVWHSSASTADLRELKAGRPNIPREIDRILLADLVLKSEVDDIPTRERYALRDAFWQAVDAD